MVGHNRGPQLDLVEAKHLHVRLDQQFLSIHPLLKHPQCLIFGQYADILTHRPHLHRT
jgi:hypothetical protein